MNVLFAASEAVPFAKTGGLADVVGSLPRALKPLGVEASVILPLYGEIPPDLRAGLRLKSAFNVKLGWRNQCCGLYEAEHGGVRYYFVDNELYYKRGYLYGYEDEAERFVFFCFAVLESLPRLGFAPDIVHCHDWQTGMIPFLLKTRYAGRADYDRIRTLFTIHNLRYQGVFAIDTLAELLGVRPETIRPYELESHGGGSCMKAGLTYADKLTTVSRTYADEILTECCGERLDGVLRLRAADLRGIVNGIDTDAYDPMTDPAVAYPYRSLLTEKRRNKPALRRELGLAEADGTPLVGIVSRLAEQKGFDLIETALDELLDEPVQLAVLGTGDPRIEALLSRKAAERPGALAVRIGFDDGLARRIYAGADMVLMPSSFEPCGLSQLIALRYGAVPIVRETGGLKDTVQAYDEYTRVGTGFSFRRHDAGELLHTVRRAISYYRNAAEWQRIVDNGTGRDYGWRESAREYASVYRELAAYGKE